MEQIPFSFDQATTSPAEVLANKKAILSELSFGDQIAEKEVENLQRYFVETDHWKRLLDGKTDIVRGPKGSGKSALYWALRRKTEELSEKGVHLISADDPHGSPVFEGLQTDPPTSQPEFEALWKLFFLTLVGKLIQDRKFYSPGGREVVTALTEVGLLEEEFNLSRAFRCVKQYVGKWFNPKEVSGGVDLSSMGLPINAQGRIVFSEPSQAESARGIRSINSLLAKADDALERVNASAWILLDRLDNSFAENQELEANALRALLKTYISLLTRKHICLKIFIRDDIWRNLTADVFREASHITSFVEIKWDEPSLLDLAMRRAVQNEAIRVAYFSSSAQRSLSAEEQRALFYRLFPEQVEEGSGKTNTLNWILTRTCDGTKSTAPRELIHLLNATRAAEIRRLETGIVDNDAATLFSRQAIKEALPEVSRTRLNQTLYSEYPSIKKYVQELEGLQAIQSIETLSQIWKEPPDVAQKIATTLVEYGFFEQRGLSGNREYWVPFLYRPALKMKQVKAKVRGASDRK